MTPGSKRVLTSIVIAVVASIIALGLVASLLDGSSDVTRLAVTTVLYGVIWIPLGFIFVIRKDRR